MSLSLVREIAQSITHLLLPQLCEGCSIPLINKERILCMSCLDEVPQTNFHSIEVNEAAMRLAGRIRYEHATAYAYFTADGLLQHLLHRLKYEGRTPIGTFLGKQAGYALQSTEWIKTVDAIVPVPLHRKKEIKRGYNQSNVIAEGLGAVLGVPVLQKALVRKRDTESQTRKNREERVSNVANAFVLSSKGLPSVSHVLLIDDVLTTGATIEAVATALLQIKELKVSVMSIGLAVN